MSFTFKFILLFIWLFFTFLMVQITLQYVPVDFGAAFLTLKFEEIKLKHYQIAFFSHVYTSIFVLIFGGFQFSETIRKSYAKIHLNLGRAYIFLILFVSAPTGLVMAYYANGGIYSQISFSIQAVLWFFFTLLALYKIRQKDVYSHQNYMILSYAFTLSAISLRLFKWIIVNTLSLPPMDTYQIVSWLGWMFNLQVAAIIILKQYSHPHKNLLPIHPIQN
jgi:Predicted membrane protein (DUF2306)